MKEGNWLNTDRSYNGVDIYAFIQSEICFRACRMDFLKWLELSVIYQNRMQQTVV